MDRNRFPQGYGIILLILAPACTAIEPNRGGIVPEPSVPQEASSVLQAVSHQEEAQLLQAKMLQAAKTFETVKDYSCVLIKQERINGKLHPEQSAQMSVFNHPFSVHLKFTSPAQVNGQEVCYASGRNNNQMRIKGNGLKGALGFITLPLNDPRVMAQSRHTVNEAGVGNLLEWLMKPTVTDGKNKSVESAKLEWNERKCLRFEVRSSEITELSPFSRWVVYFDEESKLPVRFEGYDKPGEGNPRGELLESYSYTNLKLNVNLPDDTFKK